MSDPPAAASIRDPACIRTSIFLWTSYRRSDNHAIRTNDAMHHSATGGCDVQLALWYSLLDPPSFY